MSRTFNIPLARGHQQPVPESHVEMPAFLNKVVLKHGGIENFGDSKGIDGIRSLRPFSLFFQAMHTAFADHHGFVLRPEVLNYIIVNEIATAVKLDPERVRNLFTGNAGKELITVIDNELRMGDPTLNWSKTILLFEKELADRVPSTILNYVMQPYTTHTIGSKAATMVSFMDVASPFYDYRVRTMCGIPAIKLEGEPEDWLRLSVSIEGISKLFATHPVLNPYFNDLLPILRKLAEQANPATKADVTFFDSIYKFHSGSGGDYVTGWITTFLAHIKNEKGTFTARRKFDWNEEKDKYFGGIVDGAYPTHVSTVPFIWEYYGVNYPMLFAGGILEVRSEEGCLCPRLSYGILRK